MAVTEYARRIISYQTRANNKESIVKSPLTGLVYPKGKYLIWLGLLQIFYRWFAEIPVQDMQSKVAHQRQI